MTDEGAKATSIVLCLCEPGGAAVGQPHTATCLWSQGANESPSPSIFPLLFLLFTKSEWVVKKPFFDSTIQAVLYLERINIQAVDSVISLSAHPAMESKQGQHFWRFIKKTVFTDRT